MTERNEHEMVMVVEATSPAKVGVRAATIPVSRPPAGPRVLLSIVRLLSPVLTSRGPPAPLVYGEPDTIKAGTVMMQGR